MDSEETRSRDRIHRVADRSEQALLSALRGGGRRRGSLGLGRDDGTPSICSSVRRPAQNVAGRFLLVAVGLADTLFATNCRAAG